MSIDPTAAASGVVAAAALTAAIIQPTGGLLPPGVLPAAVVGAGLGVWWDPPAAATSLRWLIAALGRLGVSSAVGVASAISLPDVLGGYTITAPLRGIHPVVIALLLGLVGHLVLQWARSRVPRPAPAPSAERAGACTPDRHHPPEA